MTKNEINNEQKNNALIIGLSASDELAKDVAKKAGIEFVKVETRNFLDGEMSVEIKSTVRNKRIFVIQSTSTPVNDNLMELIFTMDALKRSSAKEINLVIPYFGYSRADRKGVGRTSISAKVIARMLESIGADRITVFDFHASQLEGFFEIPVDNLKTTNLMVEEYKKLSSTKDLENTTIVSPDYGGVIRAKRFAELIGAPIAIVDKKRLIPNKVESSNLILGDVSGRNCVIVDDIIDTGETIKGAIKLIKSKGAKKITVICTHSVLSSGEDNAKPLERLKEAGVDTFITTNSISRTKEEQSQMNIIDLSLPLKNVIESHLKQESIGGFYLDKEIYRRE